MRQMGSAFTSKVQLSCCSCRQGYSVYSSSGSRWWGTGPYSYGTASQRRRFIGSEAALQSLRQLSHGADYERRACGKPGSADVHSSGFRRDIQSDKTQTHAKGGQTRGAQAQPPELRTSRDRFVPISRTVPYFISDLNPPDRAWAGYLPRGNNAADEQEAEAAIGAVGRGLLSWSSSCSPTNLRAADEVFQGTIHSNANPDLQRLQDRYDSLLRNPHAFGLQVQLLHTTIQKAQQLQGKQLHMRQLQPLQERLRTPGTRACLAVKPVLYAVFCVYCPDSVRIAATMRVGAAEHFLCQYLEGKSITKRKRVIGSFRFACGAAGAERWLAESSLQNVCVYPLEALSPRRSLFRSSASQRLAAWEEILGTALAC